MLSSPARVLRVGFRPLDEQRLSWLEASFGEGSVQCADVDFLDVDTIAATAERCGATVVVVEPMNKATAAELAGKLAGKAQLWRQTHRSVPSPSRPWERLSAFDGYAPVL